jgi:hypothetical protein
MREQPRSELALSRLVDAELVRLARECMRFSLAGA